MLEKVQRLAATFVKGEYRYDASATEISLNHAGKI